VKRRTKTGGRAQAKKLARPHTLVRGHRHPAIKASLELALLGLIAEMGPTSGYDLIKVFRLSMVHFWHSHLGQIYPTLERMDRDGLIQSREIIQRGRPDKRLFSITEAGTAMLLDWLKSPYQQPKIKHPPLLRMRFLGHLGAQGAREKILEERTAVSEYLEKYLDLEREYFGTPAHYANVDMMFSYFTLKQGIRMLETNLELCDWAIDQIDQNPAVFSGKSRGIDYTSAMEIQRRLASSRRRAIS